MTLGGKKMIDYSDFWGEKCTWIYYPPWGFNSKGYIYTHTNPYKQVAHDMDLPDLSWSGSCECGMGGEEICEYGQENPFIVVDSKSGYDECGYYASWDSIIKCPNCGRLCRDRDSM